MCLTFEVLYSCSSYLKTFGMGFKTRLKLGYSAIDSLQGIVGLWGLGVGFSYLDFWPLATAVGPKA